MSDEMQPTDWPAAWATLRAAAGDEWDGISEQINELWKAEYRAAFIAYALSRHGWDRENAELWCDDIVDEACIACRGNEALPTDVAKEDVLLCEEQSSDV